MENSILRCNSFGPKRYWSHGKSPSVSSHKCTVWTSGDHGRKPESLIMPQSGRCRSAVCTCEGSVAKITTGHDRTPGSHSSGGNLEQPGYEGCLSSDVTTADVLNLPFPGHRHRFEARQRSSRRPEPTEAEARTGQLFHAPVILFHNVVQEPTLPRLGEAPQLGISLHVRDRFRVGRVLVHRDRARV